MCIFELSSPRRGIAYLAAVVLATAAWPIEAAEIEGFTEPYRDIDVAAAEMGRVICLEVREGDRVVVGQVVARLDDDVINATLDIAQAGMESFGRLEAAEAELRMHQESLEKLKELLKRNHATQREVDRAQRSKRLPRPRSKPLARN